MDKITLKAASRELQGRKVNRLRKQGLLPANIFGRDVKSQSIQVDTKDFKKVFEKAGETNIVEVELDKTARPVLVHNIQVDPVSNEMLHVDFLQVDLKKKVTAEVPVEVVGISPAEKQSLGTVVQYIYEIGVETLPTEIPDKFEIDISSLTDVDQMVQVKDLKVDTAKVKIEQDPESIIVKVEPPKEEKEEIAPAISETGEAATETEESKGEKSEESGNGTPEAGTKD